MTTYSGLYYHLIWSTKNRAGLISETIENKLHAYMAGIVQGNKGTAIQIGGMSDHVHLLVRLNPDQNISDLVKAVKVASSKWLKETSSDFYNSSWQNGFGAFSVSKSQTNIVKEYILKQKEHHKIRGFGEEWLNFLKSHNIQYIEKFVFG